MSIERIKQEIIQDEANQVYTKRGIQPLFQANPAAKLLIIGQAPGQKAQDRGRLFADRSGERLRNWLGLDEATFYDATKVAILPMDFYFPGRGKSGDLPPRADFAEKWHPQLLAELSNVALTILIGRYAMQRYLAIDSKTTLTEVVANYQQYLPSYFPLIHPSPRNQIWLKKHPWYEEEVIVALKQRVSQLFV